MLQASRQALTDRNSTGLCAHNYEAELPTFSADRCFSAMSRRIEAQDQVSPARACWQSRQRARAQPSLSSIVPTVGDADFWCRRRRVEETVQEQAKTLLVQEARREQVL